MFGHKPKTSHVHIGFRHGACLNQQQLQTTCVQPISSDCDDTASRELKGHGAHVFRGLLARRCLAGASERDLFCVVRMSASGPVANACEMHIPLLAPSPKLTTETLVVDVTEPFRAHGVLLSWKKAQTQGMEHIQEVEHKDVFISDIVDTCALDTHLPIEFDESAAGLRPCARVLVSMCGQPLWSCVRNAMTSAKWFFSLCLVQLEEGRHAGRAVCRRIVHFELLGVERCGA